MALAFAPPDIGRGSFARTFLAAWLAPVAAAVLLLAGQLSAFPLYDDGWLVLLIREHGASAVGAAIPDRPLMGLLCEFICRLTSANAVPWALISVSLWCIFAWQASLLWQSLYPHWSACRPIVATLVLAPALLQAQFCTLNIALPCVAPSILALWGILTLLRAGNGPSRSQWALSCLLVGLGTMISEYAVTLTLGCSALLAARYWPGGWRRISPRTAAVVLGPAAVSLGVYAAFVFVVGLAEARPSVHPARALEVLAGKGPSAFLDLINGVWFATFAGYLRAGGNVFVQWGSKSTLLAVAVGLLLGICFVMLPARVQPSGEEERNRAGYLIAGIAICLLPVALMGRGTALAGFGSRFLIPALPMSSCFVLMVCLQLAPWSTRRVPLLLLGLACGHAATMGALGGQRERAMISSALQVLRPVAQEENGLVAAMASVPGMDYELTARGTSSWPSELARRTWIFDRDSGLQRFGPRWACILPVQLDMEVRLERRSGPMPKLWWIEVLPGGTARIEAYCRPDSGLR